MSDVIVTINICHSISVASKFVNFQSCLHLPTQTFSNNIILVYKGHHLYIRVIIKFYISGLLFVYNVHYLISVYIKMCVILGVIVLSVKRLFTSHSDVTVTI